MQKAQRKTSSKLPAISTASLPDIVFILLFFFMTVTVMQDKNLLVDNSLPKANESEKMVGKDGVIEIFMGSPSHLYSDKFGEEPRIQVNNRFLEKDEIANYVFSELSKMPESLQKTAMVSLKVDKKVTMGLVNDVKEELKNIGVQKINYATLDGGVLEDF